MGFAFNRDWPNYPTRDLMQICPHCLWKVEGETANSVLEKYGQAL